MPDLPESGAAVYPPQHSPKHSPQLPPPLTAHPVEPADADHSDLLARLVEVTNAAGLHDAGETYGVWYPHTWAGMTADPHQQWHQVLVTAPWGPGDAEVDVARAVVSLPLTDNLHRAYLDLDVLPEYRRRGVGSALMRWAQDLARASGRRVLGATSATRLGSTDDAVGFAAAFGGTNALGELQSVLRLPADASARDDLRRGLATLEAQARAHAAGYTVETWQGSVPQHFLADRAQIAGAMSTDAPWGGIDLEAENFDGERFAEVEARQLGTMRRQIFSAGAVQTSTGRLVGVTDLVIEEPAPHLGYQFDTLVLQGHRGHRLGLLIKVANLSRLIAERPDVPRLCTWNAGVNEHMLAINRALGYRPEVAVTEWEFILDPLAAQASGATIG